MEKSFDFYFDVVSPYAYLASTQMDALCGRTGAVCNWKPFFLGGVMQATSNKPPLMVAVPAKQQWMMRDVQDWADYYGVKIGFPRGQFPFNSLSYQRALVAAGAMDPANVRKLAQALYERLWGQGGDPADPSIMTEACKASGFDAAALLEAACRQEVKDRLKANTDEAVKLGAFGAPTFVYKDCFYWGNDRICLLEKALKA